MIHEISVINSRIKSRERKVLEGQDSSGKLIEDYPGVSYNISETGDFFKVEMRHTPTKTTIKPPLKPKFKIFI